MGPGESPGDEDEEMKRWVAGEREKVIKIWQKKHRSRPDDRAVFVLERYRAGKIDLELALELLGKR